MMAYWKILLTLFHGLTQIRVFMELSEPNKPWLLALEESQVPIATRWGIMSTNAAQVSDFLIVTSQLLTVVSQFIVRTGDFPGYHRALSGFLHPRPYSTQFVGHTNPLLPTTRHCPRLVVCRRALRSLSHAHCADHHGAVPAEALDYLVYHWRPSHQARRYAGFHRHQ